MIWFLSLKNLKTTSSEEVLDVTADGCCILSYRIGINTKVNIETSIQGITGTPGYLYATRYN